MITYRQMPVKHGRGIYVFLHAVIETDDWVITATVVPIILPTQEERERALLRIQEGEKKFRCAHGNVPDEVWEQMLNQYSACAAVNALKSDSPIENIAVAFRRVRDASSDNRPESIPLEEFGLDPIRSAVSCLMAAHGDRSRLPTSDEEHKLVLEHWAFLGDNFWTDPAWKDSGFQTPGSGPSYIARY